MGPSDEEWALMYSCSLPLRGARSQVSEATRLELTGPRGTLGGPEAAQRKEGCCVTHQDQNFSLPSLASSRILFFLNMVLVTPKN